jgi:hypothetical protein
MMDQINPDKAIKELTVLLMYLQRFNEQSRFALALDMAWKGYDFDTKKDHAPKDLLTMDYTPLTSYNEIKQLNVLEWLTKG